MWPDWPWSFWAGLGVVFAGWGYVFGAMAVRAWRERRR